MDWRFITAKSFAAGLFLTFRFCLQLHIPPCGLRLAVNSISSGVSIVFTAICLARWAMKSVLRAFFGSTCNFMWKCFFSDMPSFFVFQPSNWFRLGKHFCARGERGKHLFFCHRGAAWINLFSSCLWSVSEWCRMCTIRSGNSCLQLETLFSSPQVVLAHCLSRKIKRNSFLFIIVQEDAMKHPDHHNNSKNKYV